MTVGVLITCSNISWVDARCCGVRLGLAGAAIAVVEAAASRAANGRSMSESPRMDFGDTLGCVSPRSILAEAVPFSEVVRALHFLEPASRSVELEPAVARRIQVGRIGISGGEQLHAMLVERIDQ